MLVKPPPDADDDGNPLALPDPTTDVGQLIYLLEWARIRGFQVGPMVKLGRLVVQVQDLRAREGDAPSMPADLGPWHAAGYTEDE